MSDTKAKLLAAAAEALRLDGIAGLSARAVAGRADVNQALIFYHYKTLPALVVAAVRASVDDSVAFYRERFAEVDSLLDLLQVGRELHERERDLGNVAMMAQLMAGAQLDPVLAGAARYAMQVWNTEIETVIRRVLVGSPLADLADPSGLAAAVSAAFLGIELYEGVDPAGATKALDSLEHLGVLAEVMDDLGPVGRRALRSRLRRRQ